MEGNSRIPPTHHVMSRNSVCVAIMVLECSCCSPQVLTSGVSCEYTDLANNLGHAQVGRRILSSPAEERHERSNKVSVYPRQGAHGRHDTICKEIAQVFVASPNTGVTTTSESDMWSWRTAEHVQIEAIFARVAIARAYNQSNGFGCCANLALAARMARGPQKR